MDITKFNMTPGEVVKSIGERKLHPLSDYMLWAFTGSLSSGLNRQGGAGVRGQFHD